jgi:hypothetical protein
VALGDESGTRRNPRGFKRWRSLHASALAPPSSRELHRGGAPALTDLLGGQVQVMFSNIRASIEHIKAGRLRPLAVTGAMRAEALPEIPTVGEFVPPAPATFPARESADACAVASPA